MGLHFSDPWDKPKDMLKADELLEIKPLKLDAYW
jgi:hypothetical protein